MFNNENLELFGSMLKFMNKVKVVLFSWDETKKSIVIKDSLFRRFCIYFYIVQNLISSLYQFCVMSERSRHSSLRENFWLDMFIIGLLMCNECILYQFCRRDEIVEFFTHMITLDRQFNGTNRK